MRPLRERQWEKQIAAQVQELATPRSRVDAVVRVVRLSSRWETSVHVGVRQAGWDAWEPHIAQNHKFAIPLHDMTQARIDREVTRIKREVGRAMTLQRMLEISGGGREEAPH